MALFANVEPMSVAGRFAINEHAERNRLVRRRRAHDEVGVAGVEAERNPSVGRVQHACAALDRPVSGERPLVGHQHLRCGVGAGDADLGAAPRREVLALRVAEVRLRRAQVRPIGLGLESIQRGGDEVVSYAIDSRLAQQLLNAPFALVVSALAELVVADSSLRVGDVNRRPVTVVECAPDP